MQSKSWRSFGRGLFTFPAFLALFFAMSVAMPVPVQAQSATATQALGELQQFLQQQQQARQATPGSTTISPNPPAGTIGQPLLFNPLVTQNPSTPSAPPPPSRLEQIMSQRAGVVLTQFGYDQLGQGQPVSVPQTGEVQDNYVLGPGDQIMVNTRGSDNNQYVLTVDRNGQISMLHMRPMGAAGRTFGAVRADLEDAVRKGFIATEAYVSLAQVRQISVLVTGEVNNPGLRTLSGLASALDALLLSGGIKKTGSLRNVRIERQGRQLSLDLYSVLTDRGNASTMHLADGDRILVPPLGPTVAVSGLVRRPGIFELPPRQPSTSAKALLDLAGGTEVKGRYRFSVLKIMSDGRTSLTPLAGDAGAVGDSEILFVELGADQVTSRATLSGGTGLAGQYAISSGSKLSDFLKAPGALGANPYTLFGLIVRRDPRTLLRTLVAFTPVGVLTGSEDETLAPDDLVRVFQVNEIQLLSLTVKSYKARRDAEAEAIRNPLAATPSSSTSSNGSGSGASPSGGIAAVAAQNAQNAANTSQRGDVADILSATANSGNNNASNGSNGLPGGNAQPAVPQAPAQNFQEQALRPGQFATNREITSFADLAQQLGLDPLVLVNFLMDHQVTLEGAVRSPGDYFIGPNVQLQDLVQAAGGTLNWADQSGVELISTAVDSQTGRAETRRINMPLRQSTLADYVVRPHDSLRFNQVFSDVNVGTITVQGEVRFPGTYSIVRGEHLSDLLARVGGLTNTAYPYGTVFLRKSAAAAEHDGYLRMAQEVESQLLVPTSRLGSVAVPAAQIQQFADQLRNQKALGRVSLIADPSVLAAKPELDPLLENGDVLFIPQRPSTVAVLGQVMQQGNYRYEPGKTVKDYIEEAGGYAQFSDEDNTYLVLPDGSARKIDVSWLNFSAAALPPGSSIVVPRDLQPFDLRQTVIDVSSILSQIAVTVASLAVLAKQ